MAEKDQQRSAGELDEELLKNVTHQADARVEPDEEEFFTEGMRILNETGIPYMVSAAFARYVYTDVWRKTKDLDVILKPEDLKTALDAFEDHGYVTRVEHPHWLAKAFKGEDFIDLIFGVGHGQLSIDDSWFEKRMPVKILDTPTYLIPFEELLTSSMFIGERGRFDAADVVHLIRARQGQVNWQRVLELLGENWKLLLWHLLLFDFIYPGHSSFLPQDLMLDLFERVREGWEEDGTDPKEFRGTVLDPFSFTVDVEDWGYADPRELEPIVNPEGELL